ncbi:hypothetical protein D3C78_1256040 [compost metagenome]
MYRRERLHHEQFGNFDAARFGDAADIVAQQIDNHQVFRAIFGGIRQPLRLLRILLGIGQPRQRALDRAGLDLLVLQPQKTLGRNAQYGVVRQT